MKKLLTFIVSIGFVLSNLGQITNAEYFIDTDPGVGLATSISITAGVSIDETFTLPTGTLTDGLHVLHIRTKGTSNAWSLYHRSYFYIHTPNNTTVPTNIVAAEYFVDVDPGTGSATNIPITAGMILDHTFTLPTGVLTSGLHVLHIRVKDANDTWSLYHYSYFFIHNSNPNQNPTSIVDAEYFFNLDPGIGNGISIPVNNGFNILEDFTALVPLTFADGDHYIHIRAMDQDGTWSLYERRLFTVDSSLINTTDNNIEFNFKIYPNPTNGIINIKTNNVIDKIEVYSVLGKKLIEKEASNKIDISYLSSGIYTIKIKSNDRTIIYKRLVKR